MTRFGPASRRFRDDDVLLDSLADREGAPAGADSAVRLLADLAVAADAASPGVGRRAREGSRFVATSERGTRPSLAWAAAAAAAAVVAVALGTVAPSSTPGPGATAQVSPVAPVSLTRARTLVGDAEDLLGPAGSLVAPTVRTRARELLRQARAELARARQLGEGQAAERDDVEKAIVRAETALTESERGLDGRDDETNGPTPSPTESDDDEPHSESEGESAPHAPDEGAPEAAQTPPLDD